MKAAVLRNRLERLRRWLLRLAHLSVGLPDYEAYVQHLREHHPQCRVPDYAEFYRERTEARYRGGGGRCC